LHVLFEMFVIEYYPNIFNYESFTAIEERVSIMITQFCEPVADCNMACSQSKTLISLAYFMKLNI